MLRVFTNGELSAVLREAPKNSGECVKSIIHKHRPQFTLSSKDEGTVLYRGLSARFLEGPVVWFTPRLDPSFAVINQSLKNRPLLFKLYPKNKFFVEELQHLGYDAHHLSNTKNKFQDVSSVNVFLDLSQHDSSQVNFIGKFIKLQKFRRVRLFWSGRDVRSQSFIKQFLKENGINGICWFDANNTVELTIGKKKFIDLVSQCQRDNSDIEEATRNLSVIPNEEILDLLFTRICQALHTLLGADIAAQPFVSAPSATTVDSSAEIDAQIDITTSSLESIIQAKAASYLKRLRTVYPLVEYYAKCRSHLKPVKLLLELYTYLIKMPRKEGNQTLNLAVQGQYQDMRPRVWSEPEMYTARYLYVGNRGGKQSRKKPKSRKFDFPIGGNGFSHQARHCYNVSIIEYLMKVLANHIAEPIRWLDIGCGTGKAIHLINPTKLGVKKFECIGIDLARSKINEANSYMRKHKKFYCADAFNLPENILRGGFHLVTMFEFLEHVEDPADMVAQAAKLSTEFVMAGSPLDEEIHAAQCQAHLWSFSQIGYEQLFTANGLNLVLSNAMKIGQYASDHDWVSCVGSHRLELSAMKDSQ